MIGACSADNKASNTAQLAQGNGIRMLRGTATPHETGKRPRSALGDESNLHNCSTSPRRLMGDDKASRHLARQRRDNGHWRRRVKATHRRVAARCAHARALAPHLVHDPKSWHRAAARARPALCAPRPDSRRSGAPPPPLEGASATGARCTTPWTPTTRWPAPARSWPTSTRCATRSGRRRLHRPQGRQRALTLL